MEAIKEVPKHCVQIQSREELTHVPEALRTDAGVAIDSIYADGSMATLMAHAVIIIYFTVFSAVTRQALTSEIQDDHC